MKNQIVRCIRAVGLSWPALCPNIEGVAAAIATVNNDLKHPDRNNQPTGEQMNLVANLSLAIIRAQVPMILKLPKSTITSFADSWQIRKVTDAYAKHGISIDKSGKFI